MNLLNPAPIVLNSVSPQWDFFTLYSDSNEMFGGRYHSAAEAEQCRDLRRPGMILKVSRDRNGDFHTTVVSVSE